ncbi:phosphoenolpyruvate carboxykinase (ATP), partial [bacterium]|nr:phosphoenolpyruvate carboxykinase (ATP) [bacterium]
DAALNGYLATVPTHPDPVFNLPVPDHVPGVPTPILNPRFTWKDKNAYDQKALELTKRFHKNFEQFEGETARAVAGQGPRLK